MFTNIRNPKPSKEYAECIAALDKVIQHCISISQKFAGIKSPTASHYYASVLFTSLCSRSVSLAMLAPHSPWSKKKIEHWDFASIAGITRSILEIRLLFYYFCIEKCTGEEWDCRWNILNLHDCTARMQLFEALNERSDIADFNNQAEELRSRLTSNLFFMNLPESDRKSYLNGKKAFIYPLEKIAENAGVDVKTFRWLYKLLSSQVHSLPLSFYRMGEQDRGRGVHSEAEEGYTKLCISFTIKLLVSARDEMEQLFSEAINIKS